MEPLPENPDAYRRRPSPEDEAEESRLRMRAEAQAEDEQRLGAFTLHAVELPEPPDLVA